MKSYFNNLVYIDIKTSSLSSQDGEILEIAAIKFIEDKALYFHKLIKNKKLISPSVLESLDNLNKKDLLAADKLELVLDDFKLFIGDFPLVTHNAKHKKDFLEVAYFNCNMILKNTFLDTLEVISLLEPYHKEYTLKYFCDTLLSKKFINRAGVNVEYTIETLNYILERNDIGEFISFYGSLLKDWKWSDYLTHFNLNEELFKLKEEVIITSDDEFNPYTLKIKKNCEESLKDIKGFKKINPSYKFRQSQYDVMHNVRKTIDNGFVSLIEAPTGTGKSIAYLLPSIIKAYHTDEKIFISTNTKELQRQLIEKDIPFLLKTFDLNNKVDFVNIKGKGNYICFEILDEILKDSILDNNKSTFEKIAIVYLHRYSYDGNHGDFEDINYFIKEYFKLDNIIHFCSSDSDGCDVNRCNKRCFYKSVVEKLKDSSIIVLNHSLLLKWSYDVEIKNVIIDEAHNLSDSIYDAYATSLNSKELKRLLLEILDFNKKKGYLNYVWKYTQNREANFREKIRDKINIVSSTCERISYLSLKSIDAQYNLDVTFNSEYKNFPEVTHELLVLKEDLLDIYKDMSKFIESNNLDDAKIKNRAEVLLKKVDRLKEYIDFIELYTANHEKSNCYGYYASKNNTMWEAYIKDLNSSLIFFEKFLNTVSSCTFLSATLKNRGSYNEFKKSLAIDKVENTYLNEVLNINNSFDLPKRTVVASPMDSPRYYEEDFIKYMVKMTLDVLDKVPGNILILFTSKKRLLAFKEKISLFLSSNNIKLYQGKKDIEKLQDTSERSILLGSRGFFEGIDIPGDSLSVVLMDKIPIINPSDPLFSKLRQNGKSFDSINTPRVITSFKQCFGRLIRTEFDYGYFIVFDKGNNNSLWSNISREYKNVSFTTEKTSTLLDNINKRFISWNILNLNIIIEQTLDNLKKELHENKNFISLDSDKLVDFLNKFYKKELKKKKLNQNIIFKTKNKKLLAFYNKFDLEINLINKSLILNTVTDCFN